MPVEGPRHITTDKRRTEKNPVLSCEKNYEMFYLKNYKIFKKNFKYDMFYLLYYLWIWTGIP
jgi:hypothetical protein